MWFTRISIQNPVFATMMMVALMVLGLFSLTRLPVEELPDVKFPVIVVSTEYPDAAPEIVESEVTKPLEESINTISGLNQVFSHTYQGLSVVIAEFDLNVDPDKVVQDVREKVGVVSPTFRTEIKAPTISRYNPDDMPIISLAISSDKLTPRELTSRTQQFIKKRFEIIPGVGQVAVIGGTAREININVKPERLSALKLGINDINAAVQAQNAEVPVGTVEDHSSEKVIQIKGRLKTAAEFNRIIVAWRNGAPVYLSDVATIQDGQAEEDSLALVNGKRAISLDIKKVNKANTVQTADGVRKAMDDVNRELAAEGIKLSVLYDNSEGIRSSLKDVKASLLEGALLTVVIVFFFLGSWRSTVITGLTLPVALIGTFYALYLSGFTINVMTMMALSLCIGLLIDDAIVVRENIVRHTALGKDHYRAALDGTKEIGLAVLATTSTIVAVFLPVGFMGGIIGRFFHQFGITVCAAVLISMFVSFTLDPMLSSLWHDPHAQGGKRPLGRLLDAIEHGMDWLGERYSRLITWSLSHRIWVVLIAIASLVAAFALARFIGSEFVPKADLSKVSVHFTTPVGSSLNYTAGKARQVETALREFPEVIEIYTTANTGEAQGKNSATMTVTLKPKLQRTRGQDELINLFRERLGRVAGVDLRGVSPLGGGGPDGKPLQISMQGPDLDDLRQLSNAFTAELARIHGVVDIDSSMRDAKPTLNVEVDRERAASLGFNPSQIGNALRPLIAGKAASTWQAPDGENYDVNVRLDKAERTNAGQLASLYLTGNKTDANGLPVTLPLSELATIRETTSPVQINRRDLFREVNITANVAGQTTGEVQKQITALQQRFKLPAGYRFVTGGDSKSMAESAGYAVAALLLGVVFIYMILASQFGHFLQPLAIMTSLPLSLVGVLLALLMWRSTLNIFSVIGVIMLMGLVTKNAILLVDFVNHLRREGMARAEAIAEAGRVRLRPILMTTAAMVFGMMPLALALGDGAEQRAPMAHAIIGGVITSTLLTLVIVPVVFTWLDDLGSWILRKTGHKPRQAEADSQPMHGEVDEGSVRHPR
ncbi:hydrophobic/amphiphilic exporter-1, HAE1 family [Andreprevotia lacus DSM 23236]|jgi:HAE1 family hydrophobic/amphiphilic exporter-1|uniref:Hydrophobic/amphiphilic exporter-1, HAE1 family n=1 Tax=Andreprevotia lacus DSM 23236 TaxID=1121001 RepID=A0A1W1XNG6_9NEIS|nr:efflux RND transporter permease subunit [Andreprevotia lacus]SMC25520.1 hydrophobic/amphiphilic exporter-1, HAE1 family [Andreprevotia lacus DSM 23236]